jgi:hypothetical protein
LHTKTKIVSCHTADSKPVKQEVNGTMILPPFSIPWSQPTRHFLLTIHFDLHSLHSAKPILASSKEKQSFALSLNPLLSLSLCLSVCPIVCLFFSLSLLHRFLSSFLYFILPLHCLSFFSICFFSSLSFYLSLLVFLSFIS